MGSGECLRSQPSDTLCLKTSLDTQGTIYPKFQQVFIGTTGVHMDLILNTNGAECTHVSDEDAPR